MEGWKKNLALPNLELRLMCRSRTGFDPSPFCFESGMPYHLHSRAGSQLSGRPVESVRLARGWITIRFMAGRAALVHGIHCFVESGVSVRQFARSGFA